MASLTFATAPNVVQTTGKQVRRAAAGTCRSTSDSSARRVVRAYVVFCPDLHRIPFVCLGVQLGRPSPSPAPLASLAPTPFFLDLGSSKERGSFHKAVAQIRVCAR